MNRFAVGNKGEIVFPNGYSVCWWINAYSAERIKRCWSQSGWPRLSMIPSQWSTRAACYSSASIYWTFLCIHVTCKRQSAFNFESDWPVLLSDAGHWNYICWSDFGFNRLSAVVDMKETVSCSAHNQRNVPPPILEMFAFTCYVFNEGLYMKWVRTIS